MTHGQTTQMDHLRLTLKRMQGSVLQAGEAGEELTERWLNAAEVSWIKTEQSTRTFSSALKAIGGKRPDYLVGSGGASIFLDAKCLSPCDADGVTFALEVEELAKLDTAAGVFGADVAILVWSRRGQIATFYLDFAGRFNTTFSLAGKPAKMATFNASEGVTFNVEQVAT